MKISITSIATLLLLISVLQIATSQNGNTTVVALDGAREVVAEINGGFGTLYLKRGQGEALVSVREKAREGDVPCGVECTYSVKDGIGYLTVDLNSDDDDDMNAFSCLLNGKSTRTWYISMNDRVPIRFDISLGAGRASLDLTGIHVRAFELDAGAGSVRLSVDKANLEEIEEVSISAGVGSVSSRHLGNLRFRRLDFDGGLGSYRLDCTGALPERTRIKTDVGVGSMIITLPAGFGAKALTSDSWLSSQNLHLFVRHGDNMYSTKNFSQSRKKVLLDLQSGVGSVSVRWAK
jgi:hypothetical protein